MTRTILFAVLFHLIAAIGMTQEPAAPVETTPAAEASPSAPKAPAEANPQARVSETKVFTLKNCVPDGLVRLLKHRNPSSSFQAFGNNQAQRLVVMGTPEELATAEQTVNRLQELLAQIKEGDNNLYELLKSLGTEHADVLKLNAELEALDAEIVKLEAGLKHYAPPKRIEEFKTPPKPATVETETAEEPSPNATSDFQLGVVLHRTKPTEAARILKLVINDDRLSAEPEGDNIVRVKFLSATKAEVEMMASVLERLEKPDGAAPTTQSDSGTTPQGVPPEPQPSTETVVLAIKGCPATGVAHLLNHLYPDSSFKAVGNDSESRLVITGPPELLKSAEATAIRCQELLTQYSEGQDKFNELLKSLGREHPDVLKLDQELEVLDAEITKLGGTLATKGELEIMVSVLKQHEFTKFVGRWKYIEASGHQGPLETGENMEYVLDGDHLVAKSIDGLSGTNTMTLEISKAPENMRRLKIAGTLPNGLAINTLGVYEFFRADGQSNSPLRMKLNLSSAPNYPQSIDEKGEALTLVVMEKLPDLVAKKTPAPAAAYSPLAEPQSVPPSPIKHIEYTETHPVASSRENNQQLAEAVAKAMKQAGLNGNSIQIEVIDGVCALTGQWRTPEDRSLAEKTAQSVAGIKSVQHEPIARKSPEAAPPVSAVKVFALQHAQATDVAEILKQVYDQGPSKIVPDARTNSVIVTGPDAQVQEIEALLLKLNDAGQSNAEERVAPLEAEAANLIVQLQDERTKLLQSLGREHPKVKGLQVRIDTVRKSLVNSTIKDAVFLSPTDAVQWNLMASEIAQELKKDHEAFSRLHGPNGPRVTAIKEAIDSFKELHGELMFADETEIARWSAEWHKKYQPLIEKGPDALRAERDQLIEKNNSENDDKIVELEILTAWATVQQRYRERDTNAQHGVEAPSPDEDAAAWVGVVNEVIQELEKEREAIIDKNLGKHSPRVDDLDASIAQIKAANADVLTKAAKEQAHTIAEMKEIVATVFPATLAAERAERDQLLKTDPTNPRIREIDMEIATVIVMERNYAKAIAAAESGELPTASTAIAIPASDQSPKELQQQLTQLRKEYEAAEAQAHQLAKQLQQSPDATKQAELRQTVQRAFTARQSLLRAELLEMQTRLLQTQRSIDLRERISDQIIQRRVEDLLNPQLKWEGTLTRENGITDTAKPEQRESGHSNSPQPPGVKVLAEPDENGMVLVTFQPSPHSTLEQLKAGQRVFVSQTLRPLQAGYDQTPIIASGCILKDFWSNRQRSASNQPVVLLVPAGVEKDLLEAEQVGALEVHGDNPSPYRTRTPIDAPPTASSPIPRGPQTEMLAKLQGKWHLTIRSPGPVLSNPDTYEAEAEVEGNLMKVFYTKTLDNTLLNERFLAHTVKIQVGRQGTPPQIDLLFGPNEEKVNRFLALGITEFSEDVIRLCFDRSTDSESIRPQVFAVGAKAAIWELRRTPPVDSKAGMLARLQGRWVAEFETDPNGVDPAEAKHPGIALDASDVVFDVSGNVVTTSYITPHPDKPELPVFSLQLGDIGKPQPVDLLLKTSSDPEGADFSGIIEFSGEEVRLCFGDVKDRPQVFAAVKDYIYLVRLKRPSRESPLHLGVELAPAPVGRDELQGTVFRGGLRIEKVLPGTLAETHGLKAGDILIGLGAWEMVTVENVNSASQFLGKQPLKFYIRRAGQTLYGEFPVEGQTPQPVTTITPLPPESVIRLSNPQQLAGRKSNRLGLHLGEPVSLPTNKRFTGGLAIESVQPGSPADRQGIQAGDILVRLGTWETPVLEYAEFILEQQHPQSLRFYVVRNGDTLYGHLTDGPFDADRDKPGIAAPAPEQPETIHTDSQKNEWTVLGIQLAFHPHEDKPQTGEPLRGVLQVEAIRRDSPAASSTLRISDILEELGPLKITSPVHVEAVLREFNSSRLSYTVVRDGKSVKGTFRVPLNPAANREPTPVEEVPIGEAVPTVTELEGDWHLVAYFDHEGKPQEMLPSNRSFRGDQSSFVGPGHRHDCRIKVDPIKKTLWSYSKEEDGSFGQDYYELKGHQLILRNEPGAVGYQVFERGLVRIPSVVPPATEEQKLLWRSAIVEIVTYGDSHVNNGGENVVGRGVVVSPGGLILAHLAGRWDPPLKDRKVMAKFDDGSQIPLTVVEEGGGFVAFQPEKPINVNHYFQVSTAEVQLQDEVRVWGPDHSQAGSDSLAPFANTVTALDRKYPALGIAVWQLRLGHHTVLGTPILDAEGDLLGITITGTRDLLLAVPVAQLKALFPKSLGQLTPMPSDTPPAAPTVSPLSPAVPVPVAPQSEGP